MADPNELNVTNQHKVLMKTNLVGLYYTKIVKSLKYLEYSFNRTLTMPLDPTEMNDAQLEAWDSFASRFARTSGSTRSMVEVYPKSEAS